MEIEGRVLVRLAIRACRIAFRNIGGMDYQYQQEVARRIQEVWEEEGVDLSPLTTYQCHGDSDHTMREVYRDRKEMIAELRCEYCGELVEVPSSIKGKYCSITCHTEMKEAKA